MLTHKQFVEMIYDNSNDYTCPLEVCDVNTCETCAERIATEYEDKIRANERRTVIKWIDENIGFNLFCDAYSILKMYEKEVTK